MAHSDSTIIHFMKVKKSQPSIRGVITVQIQCVWWTPPCNVWKCCGSVEDQTRSISWQFMCTWLRGKIQMLQWRFGGHTLKTPIKSFDWRWRDDRMTTPKFIYIRKMLAFSDFSLIKPFGKYNPWISCFDPLLDSILRLGSDWNQDFIEGEGRIHCLNYEFLVFDMPNEKPWSCD